MSQDQKQLRDFFEEMYKASSNLRENYFLFQDFKNKGQLKLQQKISSGGKFHYDYDLNAQEYMYQAKNHVFFQHPDIQQEFINAIVKSFLEDIKTKFETSSYPDQIAKQFESLIQLKNDPESIKKELVQQFHKRIQFLRMKKQKTIIRYSNFNQELIPSENSLYCDKLLISRVNLIDLEMIMLERRIERMKVDECFTKSFETFSKRPVALNDKGSVLYKNVDEEELCFSNIAREDIEVYLRQKIFSNKSSRDIWKFFYHVKFLHYTKRIDIIKRASEYVNAMRVKNQQQNAIPFKKLLEYFDKKINKNYQSIAQDFKVYVSDTFQAIKSQVKDSEEYHNLALRYDQMPIWPSTQFEQMDLVIYACAFYMKPFEIKMNQINNLIFNMNTIISILFDINQDMLDFEILEQVKKSNLNEGGEGGGGESLNTKPKKKEGIKSSKELSKFEEQQLLSLLKKPFPSKKKVILKTADWLNLLKFKPQRDEYTDHVKTVLEQQRQGDSLTKLILNFVQIQDLSIIRKFLREQAIEIVRAAPDKFFVMLENTQYMSKSHNNISLNLLYDMYEEGKKTKNRPFDTDKSKILQIKSKIKSDYLSKIELMLNEELPEENIIEVTYGFIIIKIIENKRKLVNILNAQRSIQRRISFDLLRILDCDIKRDLDDQLLLDVNNERRDNQGDNTGKQKSSLLANLSSSFSQDFLIQREQNFKKDRRKNFTDMSELNRQFDQKFIQKLGSCISLGRFDQIVYEDHITMEDENFEDIPDVYVKGDDKDALGRSQLFVMYDITMKDMEAVENRIYRLICYFLEKFEKVSRVKDFFSLVDRFLTIEQVITCEMRFQFAKLRCAEAMMQIYEHVCDPVQLYKIADSTLNIIEQIPIIDFQGYYFKDSYDTHTQLYRSQTKLLKKLFEQQKNQEIADINSFHYKLSHLVKVPSSVYQAYTEQSVGGCGLGKMLIKQQLKSIIKKNSSQQSFTSFEKESNITGDGLEKNPKDSANKLKKLEIIQEQENQENHKENVEQDEKDPALKKENSVQKIDKQETNENMNRDKNENQQNDEEEDFLDLNQSPDDPYENYLLSKEMDEVFQELADRNEIDPAIKEQEAQLKAKSGQQIQENFIVHRKFEGGPHHLYMLPTAQKVKFSPLCQETEYLNFYESSKIIFNIQTLFDQIIRDLLVSFPQRSTQQVMALRLSLFNQAIIDLTSFKFTKVKNIEDSIICDDENVLETLLQSLTKKICDTIGLNNEIAAYNAKNKDTSITQKNVSQLPPNDFLLNLDYNTLESYLKGAKIEYSHNYRELFLACNLVELLKIREKLLHVIWEKQVLHKVYKLHWRTLGLNKGKKEGIYLVSGTFCPHQIGKKNLNTDILLSSNARTSTSLFGNIGSGNAFSQSQGDQEDKKQKNVLAIVLEIDQQLGNQFIFNKMQNVEYMLMMDSIQDVQTALMYEEINRVMLDKIVKLNQNQLNALMHIEMELNFLINSKIVVETPVLNIQRLYLQTSKLFKLRDQLESTRQQLKLRQGEKFSEFITKKDRARNDMINKYRENIQTIQKEFESIKVDPLKQILIEKNIKNLRMFMIRILCMDYLKDACYDSSKLEMLHYIKNIQSFIKIIPKYEDIFYIQPEKNLEFEEKFYFDQKKLNVINQNVNQDQKLFDTDFNVINPFFLYSQEEIIHRDFPRGKECTYTYYINRLDHKTYKIVNQRKVFSVGAFAAKNQQQQGTQSAKQQDTQQEKANAFNFLLKIKKKLTGDEKPDYGKYQYLDQKNIPLFRITKYYQRLYLFLEKQFEYSQLSLSNEEIKTIRELLIYNMNFNDLNPDKDVEQQMENGKNISTPLLAYDEIIIQTQNNQEKLELQQQWTNNTSKQNKRAAATKGEQQQPEAQKKINYVNETIDATVRALEYYSNIAENFNKLKQELEVVKRKFLPDMRDQSLMRLGEMQQYLKKQFILMHKRMYLALFQTFLLSYTADKAYSEKYFDIVNLVYNKTEKNQLGANHFQTDFVNVGNNLFLKNGMAFKNGYREFLRFHKKIYFNQENNPYLKLKLLYTNLPTQFQKYLFNIQKRSKLIVIIPGADDSVISSLTDLFTKKKYVNCRQLPTIGFNTHIQYFSNYTEIDELDKHSIWSNAKNYDRIANMYVNFKSGTDGTPDFHYSNYINLCTDNLMLTQAILIYKYTVNYPLLGVEYIKLMNEFKQVVTSKVIEVKSNYQQYVQQQNFKLHQPDLIQCKLADFSSDSDYMFIYKNMLEMAIESEFDKILKQDACQSIQEEFSMHQIFINMTQLSQESFIYKNLNNKLGGQARALLPRVKLNPCYSSPLIGDSKNAAIPTVAKVAFLYSFINRLRNKISRVDLLSSGFGFVVAVNDLEDCINYLTKSLYGFADREIKKRMESSQFIFDLLNTKIRSQNKEIEVQRLKIQQLEDYNKLQIDVIVHQKGNNLIYELGLMHKKHADFQRFTLGLEDKIRDEIKNEMRSEMDRKNNEYQILKKKFTDFVREIKALVKQDIKQAGVDIADAITKKMYNILDSINQPTQSQQTKQKLKNRKSIYRDFNNEDDDSEIENEDNNQGQNPIRMINNDQQNGRCQLDEDIIDDPYELTKYVNKIRTLYLLKIGLIKENYENKLSQLSFKLKSFGEIHSKMLESQRQEEILKKELVSVHNILKDQEYQNQQLRHELESTMFEKLRIEKAKDDFQKKFKQLEEESKLNEKRGVNQQQESKQIEDREDKIKQLIQTQRILEEQVNIVKKTAQSKLRNMEEKLKNEQDIKKAVTAKMETDFPFPKFSASNLEQNWKEKCQELYNKNTELEDENLKIKNCLQDFMSAIENEGQFLNQNPQLQSLIDNLKSIHKLIRQQSTTNQLEQQANSQKFSKNSINEYPNLASLQNSKQINKVDQFQLQQQAVYYQHNQQQQSHLMTDPQKFGDAKLQKEPDWVSNNIYQHQSDIKPQKPLFVNQSINQKFNYNRFRGTSSDKKQEQGSEMRRRLAQDTLNKTFIY